jgi:DUF1126 PH-like domain
MHRERKFVLSYFCGDDTLSIFEPPQRNTGITGGRFLERARVSPGYPPSCNCQLMPDFHHLLTT